MSEVKTTYANVKMGEDVFAMVKRALDERADLGDSYGPDSEPARYVDGHLHDLNSSKYSGPMKPEEFLSFIGRVTHNSLRIEGFVHYESEGCNCDSPDRCGGTWHAAVWSDGYAAPHDYGIDPVLVTRVGRWCYAIYHELYDDEQAWAEGRAVTEGVRPRYGEELHAYLATLQ